MSKSGSVRSLNRIISWLVVAPLALAACAVPETATTVPTQALIPATITDTSTPVPPTATLPALPGPDDLLATPRANAPLLIPAALQPLVQRVIADLASYLNVDPGVIQLALVEERTWINSDLGCGAQTMPSLEQAIEGYRLVLLVDNAPYEYHTDGSSLFRRCGAVDAGAEESDVLVQTDPVAAELVELARRRLAADQQVSTDQVRLVEIMPVQWTDSSLGCPQRGESYPAAHIDGYRIVLAVDDDQYIFHADFDRVFPCAARDEVIPSENAN